MPPVNAFKDEDDGKIEEAFALDLYLCPNCFLIQLGNIVPPEKLFSNYHHTSSASAGNVKHLKNVSELLNDKGLVNGKKILEIGSNDGLLLSFLKAAGGEVLGVDPAENLHSDAEKRGVNSLIGFFDEKFAESVLVNHPKFDTIVALNVMAHTPTFTSALRGIKKLLSEDGFFVMENAYVLDTVLEGQFDTIYHEHIFSFSLHSLIYAYEMAGLAAIDAQIIPSQGTSIRVTITHNKEGFKQSRSLIEILEREKRLGFESVKKFEEAALKIVEFKSKLTTYLNKYRNEEVIGLGAPARGVVILNYCRINSKNIQFIIDDTPLKQNKLVPGVKIPVRGWDSLDIKKHKRFIIFSWNYAETFIQRLKSLGVNGSILIPFPNFSEIHI
jgi:SAM-dependent methyltransferase